MQPELIRTSFRCWVLVAWMTACCFAPVRLMAQKEHGEKAGEERSDNGPKMKLVWCPPGKFKMGSPATDFWVAQSVMRDESQVSVSLSRGFWIGKYEVTQGQWKELMKTEPWKGKQTATENVHQPDRLHPEGDERAASFVSWQDATKFCQELTKIERQHGRISVNWEYRLPTEAQWEYACRAGTNTPFSFSFPPEEEDAYRNKVSPLQIGKRIDEYAWWGFNLRGQKGLPQFESGAQKVGQKKPNAWGLYDMHGNVAEYCQDYYQEQLPGGTDPVVTNWDWQKHESRWNGASLPDYKPAIVLRGGDWFSYFFSLRSASRNTEPFDGVLPNWGSWGSTGFRVVCVPVRYQP